MLEFPCTKIFRFVLEVEFREDYKTAERCFDNYSNSNDVKDYKIHSGTSFLSEVIRVFNVKTIIKHRDFKRNKYENDVALIEIENFIDHFCRPIVISGNSNSCNLDKTGYIIGWEETINNYLPLSINELQKVKAEIIDKNLWSLKGNT